MKIIYYWRKKNNIYKAIIKDRFKINYSINNRGNKQSWMLRSKMIPDTKCNAGKISFLF
jgi:hypothetical protein